MKSLLLLSLSLTLTISGTQASAAERLRLMSYNVENLFDTQHDLNKNDWEFLPKNFPGRDQTCAKMPAPWMIERCLENDWTEEKLETKLNQIKRVVDATGKQLPDVLAVVEVENEAVVQRLSAKLGYKEFVITEALDPRGIDVALLFNQKAGFQLVKAEKIRLPIAKNSKPTRDILKVIFKTGTHDLVLFVNHWPSQESPASERKVAAEVMMKSASEEMKKGHAVVAMGDFNVIAADRPDPFYDVFMNPRQTHPLIDVHSAVQASAKELKIDLSTYPAGTYFFAPAFVWNMLDRFFVSPDLLKAGTIQADLRSYRILSEPFMTETTQIRKGPHAGSVVAGTPLRAKHNEASPHKAGYSDHFPILLDLVLH